MKLIHLFEIEPQERTQSLINNTHGWGRVPNNQNVDYLGMRVLMKPSLFLKLAAPLERSDAHSLRDMVAHLRSGGTVASPWLVIQIPDAWEDGDYDSAAKVVSHEGRNRMYAIQEVIGDVPVEVHMFFASGLRARHIQPDWVQHMRSHLIPQGAKTAQAGDWFTPTTQAVAEAWSKKYKKSINCDNPKGFSQRAHCAGRKKRQAHKHTQSKSMK